MPKRFGKIVLASTGDHDSTKDEQIKNWVEHAGGRFVKDISSEVTHLVCSSRAWKRYYPIVREARRLRSIHIVKLNWLEESLLSKPGKPLDTAPFQWEQRKVVETKVKKRRRDDSVNANRCGDVEDAARRKEKSVKRVKKQKSSEAGEATLSKDELITKAAKEFDEACAEFEQFMEKKGYRPFTDRSGFVYLLTLLRKDVLKNRLEKFKIKVRYAPLSSAQYSTPTHIALQGGDRRRKVSNPRMSGSVDCNRASDMGNSNLLRKNPILPPCPVPLYYFPDTYPYCRNPCILSSPPRQLTSANPNLRVRIPEPWAQSLQIFVSESPADTKPSGNSKYSTPSVIHHPDLRELRARSYAAYIVYTKPGSRHVQTLVPPGSTFDFAWTVFTKVFKKKTNIEWADVHNGWKAGLKFEEILRRRFGGEDGAGDHDRWEICEAPAAVRLVAGADRGNAEWTDSQNSEPSVTVVMNKNEALAADQMEERAKTPEGGW